MSLFLYIFDNLEHVLFPQQRRHFDSTLSVADVVWNCVGHSLCLAHFQSRAGIFSSDHREPLLYREHRKQVLKPRYF